MPQAQANPVNAVIGVVVVAIIARLGIYLFSELNQTLTVTGQLNGTGTTVLSNGASALAMAVGGTSIAVTAILILRART